MRPSNNTNDYLIIEDYITFNAKMCKCKKYFRSFLVTWKILKWNMQNFFSSVMWKLLKQNTIYYLSNISKNFNVPGWIWTGDLSHLNLTLYQLSYQGFDEFRIGLKELWHFWFTLGSYIHSFLNIKDPSLLIILVGRNFVY